ncbi:alpha-ribazole transporter [Anaerobacillus alkalidiazotrophicus]|uniref:Alpha-ribazole transporter n=1 Tax=Anaerobacillus alkalidiazotrophicus TaxID=472963 RepID=A0A1S2LW13_9BACI|nr:ECF transporter S component [Anaerobacillus alkalidiazotrophicus]OIJ16526.1 alpha-ribazole transporter [Anaerobacillus alkalidiazotrophicus]
MLKVEKGVKTSRLEIRKISILGIFIAISVVGSFIKIPSPFGTVAFDSAPAFLAALLLGPTSGALVGFMGHILTSLNVGFPLSIPIHLFISLEMAFVCAVVGIIYKKGFLIPALMVGVLLNGVVLPASFILIPQFGVSFFVAMIIPLVIGSALNLIVSGTLVRYLKGRIKI